MATIRQMSVGDVDRLFELECELFGNDAWDKETLLDSMDMFHFDVLEVNENIVGYIMYTIMYENGDLLNIGVSKKCQRQGYAHLLMDHMLNQMKDAEVEMVTLEVRVSNEPAINLYKSYGFEIGAKRRQYYKDGEDAYLMIRPLEV